MIGEVVEIGPVVGDGTHFGGLPPLFNFVPGVAQNRYMEVFVRIPLTGSGVFEHPHDGVAGESGRVLSLDANPGPVPLLQLLDEPFPMIPQTLEQQFIAMDEDLNGNTLGRGQHEVVVGPPSRRIPHAQFLAGDRMPVPAQAAELLDFDRASRLQSEHLRPPTRPTARRLTGFHSFRFEMGEKVEDGLEQLADGAKGKHGQ